MHKLIFDLKVYAYVGLLRITVLDYRSVCCPEIRCNMYVLLASSRLSWISYQCCMSLIELGSIHINNNSITILSLHRMSRLGFVVDLWFHLVLSMVLRKVGLWLVFTLRLLEYRWYIPPMDKRNYFTIIIEHIVLRLDVHIIELQETDNSAMIFKLTMPTKSLKQST